MRLIKAPTPKELGIALDIASGCRTLLEAYINGTKMNMERLVTLCWDLRELEAHVVGGELSLRAEVMYEDLKDWEAPMIEITESV